MMVDLRVHLEALRVGLLGAPELREEIGCDSTQQQPAAHLVQLGAVGREDLVGGDAQGGPAPEPQHDDRRRGALRIRQQGSERARARVVETPVDVQQRHLVPDERGRRGPLGELPIGLRRELNDPEVERLAVQLQEQGQGHADADGGGDRQEERRQERRRHGDRRARSSAQRHADLVGLHGAHGREDEDGAQRGHRDVPHEPRERDEDGEHPDAREDRRHRVRAPAAAFSAV